MPTVALYARVSTDDQDPDRQLEELREHAAREFPEADIETFADVVSGTEEGEAYHRLWDAIGEERLEAVVVHEVSRLSRLGAGEIEEFIGHALKHGTAVEDLEVGLSIRVDGSELERQVGELVATIMGKLAQIEREQTLRRIRSGIRSAQEAGTWTGRPPRGFSIGEDGRLRVDPDEFVRVRDALERVLAGEPLVRVAEAAGIPESTLRRLRDERLELYFLGEADDDRLEAAVDASDIPTADPPEPNGDLERLRQRVAALEEHLGEPGADRSK